MKRTLLILMLILVFVAEGIAQVRTITGTVTDSDDGSPVPGVSIRIRGAQGGTQTGSDGKYSIAVPTGATGLEFTSIGYNTQSIALGSSNVINVRLVSSAQSLGEVVVTANAIKRERRSLGYSAPVINTEELNQGQQPSVINSITGRVAGVNITTTSNTPGASSSI